jgi:hypothetical protein
MENVNNNKKRNNILNTGSRNLNSENWKVFHPNGRHMFTCGERKAQWYINNDLAIKVGNKKIKFTFIPKGNGFEDDEEFGRSDREYRCVVTGCEEGLQRHHIVPYCYRMYFPNEFKSKNHHDVVLINHEKHSEYEQLANEYKDIIAKIYNVKTIDELNTEYTLKLRGFGREDAIVISSMHSLFKTYGKIPQDLKIQKLHFIAEKTNIPYDQIERFNYIQLYKLYLLLKEQHIVDINEFKRQNKQKFDHGYHVAQKLNTEEKISEFIKLWRNHFIDIMKPRFMPNGWSIDFRIKTNM